MNGRGEESASAARASGSNRSVLCIDIGGGGAGGSNGAGAGAGASTVPSRYEAQKRRDWNTFGQYLKNHRPPLLLARCCGNNVVEFLRYLDQFGKTKVHLPACPFFGQLNPPSPCTCPLRQAWGSLDALIGRLRAAYDENGGKPEANPFGARVVRTYLREVRDHQARARGISHHKKKRKPRPTAGSTTTSSSAEPPPPLPAAADIASATNANPASSLDSIEPLTNHSMYDTPTNMMMLPLEDFHLHFHRS